MALSVSVGANNVTLTGPGEQPPIQARSARGRALVSPPPHAAPWHCSGLLVPQLYLFTGMAVRKGTLKLHWILVFSTAVGWCSASTYEATEGGLVVLPCRYSVKRHGLSHLCWGRSCGTFWCHDILLQADGDGIISKVSEKYRFTGDVLAGHVDLIIPRVKALDGGLYCCRVDIDGYFNDKKILHTLTVVKAPVAMTSSLAPVTHVTKPYSTTYRWMETKRWPSEPVQRKSSPPKPRVIEENPLPSPSLRINVPVLSFSLSVLLVLLGFLALMGLKREIQKRRLKTESQTAVEPPHIIHEIQTRKPLEENIYTLD
ncbi:uncharacterized protein [Paramormyrops kingsleyae]|uniref:uncharacterized protein isoform X2 n=1 Tax=Paramormyrops kingsleyae TaxID=1676925 RepID=UPI003B9745D4